LRDADHLVDEGGRADLVDVLGDLRLVVLGALTRRDERDGRILRDGFVDELDRSLLADGEWGHRIREDDGLLEGQDRQDLGHGLLARAHCFLDRAHASSTDSMVTRTEPGTFCARGSWIERRPFSYVAVAASESTASFS